MATGAMLWGGASYNNGIVPLKNYILGEAYDRDGNAAILEAAIPVTEEMKKTGILDKLVPLPAWEVIPPGDIFRVFERGGRNIVNLFPEIRLPNSLGPIAAAGRRAAGYPAVEPWARDGSANRGSGD